MDVVNPGARACLYLGIGFVGVVAQDYDADG